MDLRTSVKRLGAKEKARRKKYKLRCSITKKNLEFSRKELLEGGRQEAATCRHDASKNVGGACSRQTAAAAGKKSTTSLSMFMEACGLEVEEELSTTATQFWAEGGFGLENGVTSKKKLG